MQVMHNNSNQGKRAAWRESTLPARAAGALGAIIATVSVPALGEIDFTPSIKLGATWTDNIELATNSQGESTEYVAEVMPGFVLTQETKRIKTQLEYTLRNFFYQKESDRDTSFHEASAATSAEVVRDWFFIDASGAYSQQIIDPTRPTNNNFLFDVGNLTDTLSASVTPAILHEFDFALLDVSYTRGILDYKQSGDVNSLTSDADTEQRRAAVSSPDDNRFISWGAEYDGTITEFDNNAQRFEFEQVNAELGVRITDELRLIGRGGKESDVEENVADGGLEETTWEAGFAYSPDPGTLLEAFYGKRFFGNSYRASARREAQFLQLSASYDEGPVTQAQQLLAQPGSFQVTPIAPIDPGTNPIGTLTADVFIAKNLEATIGLTGRRTKLNLSALDQRREYVNTPERERVTGGRVTVIRNLSARTDATLDVFLTDTQFRNGDNFDEQSYRLGLTRTLSERISATFMVGRVNRNGTSGYTANWANLGLTASF
jgi:hypothetical protein